MQPKTITSLLVGMMILVPAGLGVATTTTTATRELSPAALPSVELKPLLFSPKTMLVNLWERYKETYVGPDGRTSDPDRNGATTSEAQSYTMLRAVWMDDQETFDRAWAWTREHLDRPGDGLHAWFYGKRSGGGEGILTEENGMRAASDADQDIALALLFAHARWQEASYRQDALAILNSIWEHEVIVINGTPYLAAHDLDHEALPPAITLNPSYFAPYAYRIFAEADPAHPWEELIDSSYAVLAAAPEVVAPEDTAGLPPNWIAVDRQSGRLLPIGGAANHFGFDALRIPWRIGLDARWNADPRAEAVLESMEFIPEQWVQYQWLAAEYTPRGTPAVAYAAPAMRAMALPVFFETQNNETAQDFYKEQVFPFYNADVNAWREPLSYYDDNWTWFSMALYHDLLPNLAEPPDARLIPTSASLPDPFIP